MAMITCPECGKSISDKAKSCVNCGSPISLSGSILIVERMKKKIPALTLARFEVSINDVVWGVIENGETKTIEVMGGSGVKICSRDLAGRIIGVPVVFSVGNNEKVNVIVEPMLFSGPKVTTSRL
jgi:hypothetical protein